MCVLLILHILLMRRLSSLGISSASSNIKTPLIAQSISINRRTIKRVKFISICREFLWTIQAIEKGAAVSYKYDL